jgi:hypothetical protein
MADASDATPTASDDDATRVDAAAAHPDTSRALNSSKINYVNVDATPQELMCAECHAPLLDPVCLPCGDHMVCHAHIIRGQLQECPVDHSPLPDPTNLLPMKQGGVEGVIVRQLNAIQVRCTHAAYGCEWTGRRGNLSDHLVVNCAHHACPQRSRAAEGCEWIGTLTEHLHHVDACPFVHVPCPHVDKGCDARAIERQVLEHHLAEDCTVALRLQHEQKLAADAAAAETREQEAVLERRRKKLLADLARVSPPAEKLVRINVGGMFHATVDRDVFTGPLCPRDSLLGTLFDPTSGFKPSVVGDEVFIHRDGGAFALLLRYLIEGGVPIGYSFVQKSDLRAEAQFWRLPPVDATVEFKFGEASGQPPAEGKWFVAGSRSPRGWSSRRAATGGNHRAFGTPKPSFVGLPKPSFVVPTSPSAARPSNKNGCHSFGADAPEPKSGIFSGLKLTAPAAGVRMFGSAAKFSSPSAQPAGSLSGPASAGAVSSPSGTSGFAKKAGESGGGGFAALAKSGGGFAKSSSPGGKSIFDTKTKAVFGGAKAAGSPKAYASAKADADDDGGEGDGISADDGIRFEAVVKLTKVETSTGEEGWKELMSVPCKL